jgi:hypothetical protein
MICVLKILLTQDRIHFLNIGEDSLHYFCRHTNLESRIKQVSKEFSFYGFYTDKGLYLIDTDKLNKKGYSYDINQMKSKLKGMIKSEMRNKLISNLIK